MLSVPSHHAGVASGAANRKSDASVQKTNLTLGTGNFNKVVSACLRTLYMLLQLHRHTEADVLGAGVMSPLLLPSQCFLKTNRGENISGIVLKCLVLSTTNLEFDGVRCRVVEKIRFAEEVRTCSDRQIGNEFTFKVMAEATSAAFGSVSREIDAKRECIDVGIAEETIEHEFTVNVTRYRATLHTA
ncbi:hypothetical protein CEXT_615621 [Caerostris extrusa]|uniref:Uncharacterized protein n=1 Tax=Caerostris extrusa TaxID=172846 RepID=A0AAV4U8Y6_CAEEX|nr:hypothetical protein CEXT_615621 [Caerostris extrusa]